MRQPDTNPSVDPNTTPGLFILCLCQKNPQYVVDTDIFVHQCGTLRGNPQHLGHPPFSPWGMGGKSDKRIRRCLIVGMALDYDVRPSRRILAPPRREAQRLSHGRARTTVYREMEPDFYGVFFPCSPATLPTGSWYAHSIMQGEKIRIISELAGVLRTVAVEVSTTA